MRTLELVSLVALFALSCSSGDDTPDGAAGMSGSSGSAGTGGTGGGAGMPGSAGMATSGSGGMPGGAGMTGGAGMPGGAGMTGGAGMPGGAGMGNNGDYPPDLTMDGLIAMIEAEGYKGATWKSDRTDINTMPDEFSPHGHMRIWYNQTVRQSNAQGEGTTTAPFDSGSMVVKEMYTGTGIVGHAVMLRAGTTWFYYCLASEDGRCSSSSVAGMAQAVSSGGVGSCSCHGGGTVITQTNIPAP
jgi:hypothetical protein